MIPSNRRGISWSGTCAVIGLMVVLPVVTWRVAPQFSTSAGSNQDRIVHVVSRGEFDHVLVERGEIESSSNDEVRCQVHAQTPLGTPILWIVAEGTRVEPGEELVQFDSAALIAEQQKQQIACNASAAKVAKADNTLKTAVIAKREYEVGVFKQDEQTAQADVLLKEESLRQAEKRVKFTEQMRTKGYVADGEVEVDRLAVKKALTEHEAAKTKLHVLQEFTREKKLLELQSAIETARAELESERSSQLLDQEKLRLVEAQIEKCTVRATVAGQVVYPEPFWTGESETQVGVGVPIREGQVVLRLPDLKRMQVNTKINESKVHRVQEDMPATVRLEAMPSLGELAGKVVKVKEYPERTSFWKATKEYSVIVEIPDPPRGLRPGMNAEVKIHVAHQTDVLTVPLVAVVERSGKFHCARRSGDAWEVVQVEIGSNNDKVAVVESGLTEGNEVLLNLNEHADKLGLVGDDVYRSESTDRDRS